MRLDRGLDSVWRVTPSPLVQYIAIVFFIFLAEIAGGILAYVYRAEARTLVVGGLNTTINQFYGADSTTGGIVTQAVDQVQQQVIARVQVCVLVC